MEPDLEKQLHRIEEELGKIHKAVNEDWKSFFLRGFFRGSGFVVGTVIAIALAGWLLNIFGVLPGIGEVASKLQTILEARSGL